MSPVNVPDGRLPGQTIMLSRNQCVKELSGISSFRSGIPRSP
ncbi:hypothetical protein I656_03544 [Geobacillus sp. WSUCF1]|nr:hypothetical protein I656_03544 [Geobacillus sp. WSUCF1]